MKPDRVLGVEPPEAKTLEWLPLAVRLKLDDCGLKVRLADWQGLAASQRQALLACPAGSRFRSLVLALVPHARLLPQARRSASSFESYLHARMLRSHPARPAPTEA